MSTDLSVPILLQPRAVERVWGGRRIAEVFGRTLPEGVPIGESWEIYGELEVASGPWQGKTLDELTRQLGHDLVGTANDAEAGFPLLTKWLDCNQWLSVQVHPDDAVARRLTGNPRARGKTECWYFSACDPGAEVIHGLSDAKRLEQLEGAQLLEIMSRIKPHQGDFLLTSAGVVHALGPGILLYEIQQSSDITYRLYDWDRPAAGRPLHRAESLAAVRDSVVPPPPPAPAGVVGRLEILCPFFAVESIHGAAAWEADRASFEILTLLAGEGQIVTRCGAYSLSAGGSAVIAAAAGSIATQGDSGHWLRTRAPFKS